MGSTIDTASSQRLEWLQLLHKSNKLLEQGSIAELIEVPGRFQAFSRRLEGLLLDFSRVRLDEAALRALLGLARACALEDKRDALFAGEPVNDTELRPALHMALRTPEVLQFAARDEADRVKQAMRDMQALAGSLHAGQLPEGGRVRHVVHVGIGGSLLGTRLLCEALEPFDAPLSIHFLGSVDAHLREHLLRRLDPAETLVVLVSKSFTTGDTLLHGRRLAAWMLSALGRVEAERRMVAVTSQPERTTALPVTPGRVLYFPDWVGGRYSLWSPVSLSAAASMGPARFTELLAGAATMDRHFRETPLTDNLPVLLGLVGVWNRNFRRHAAWGVMPYDQRLRLLPAHLQQVIMESTGKSITHAGLPVDLATAPVVFGETGTEAQHSVFQAMHQGSDIVPLHFVGVIRPQHDDREAHDELLANLLAQMTALARGRDRDRTRTELGLQDERLLAHRSFAGNRPSELILLDELTPRTLGMLLALYEHKVFVESVIWDVNAFDQWGVELGKSMAPGILGALEGGEIEDISLIGLLEHIRAVR